MEPIRLTNEQARRFLLRLHGLLGSHIFHGKDGVVDCIRRCSCIQFDPIDVCGINAELVLQSRVKGFSRDMLDTLLYTDRRLFDYFDKQLAILPIEDWPYFARERARYAQPGRSHEAIEAAAQQVRDVLSERECVSARDLDMGEKVDWYWSASTLGRAVLETLYFRGELCIHHKERNSKYYALSKNHIPAHLLHRDDPHANDDAYLDWHTLRRIGAVGLMWNRASDAFLNIPLHKNGGRAASFARLSADGKTLPVSVDGINTPLYAHARDAELLAEVKSGVTYAPRMEMLAPLDTILWDRKLIQAMFDFDYTWEIYTPKEKRQYGYYVLPLVHGECFAGRVEVRVDRPRQALVLENVWWEGRAKPAQLKQCLRRFARYHGCREVVGLDCL